MGNLAGWPYWKDITIAGQAGSGTDYQIELSIGDSAGGDFHLESHCTNFPQDIRITDDDGTTLLDHWVEDLTADPIVVHVEVKDDLGSNRDIRVYYGKSGESSASNGDATFEFFDNFPGSSLDTNKWAGDTGFASVSGNILTVNGNTNEKSIYSKTYDHPSDGVVIEYEGKPGSTEGWTRGVGSQKYTAPADSHKGHGGIGYYGAGNEHIKVYDYAGNGHAETLAFSNVWTDQQVKLKPTEISVTILSVTSSISNTLESHPVGIYIYNDWQIKNFRVRKYNATEPAFSSAGAEQSAAGAPTGVFYGPLVGPFGGPI